LSLSYPTEFPIARLLRDAPSRLIGEGTTELQRLIARHLIERNPV
jgi:alkylation response protein AidB-like acyl-CoA dehydrogenase